MSGSSSAEMKHLRERLRPASARPRAGKSLSALRRSPVPMNISVFLSPLPSYLFLAGDGSYAVPATNNPILLALTVHLRHVVELADGAQIPAHANRRCARGRFIGAEPGCRDEVAP